MMFADASIRCRRALPILAAVLIVALMSGPAPAQNQSTAPSKPLSPSERHAIEDIVRQYILKNPELLIEAIQGLRDRQERDARERAQANLIRHRSELLNDPVTPVAGNPKGDVTIVEFFDYRCGFCKRVFAVIQKVLETDRNVRIVMKEFPILGPDSLVSAKAALAASLIDPAKYMAFHTALMEARGTLSESRILKMAVETGLDARALKVAMGDPRINDMIKKNHALAEALDINGTPAFIIGDEIVRGAIDLAEFKRLVSIARGS